ncbi:MAG: GNAT family N-acetyltransferase [Polyangiaceae bacterium]
MLTVRRVVEDDVEALTPLKAEVHASHVTAHPDIFKAMTHDQLARWMRDRLAEDNTHAWVAEEAGAVLGYAMAAQRSRGETTFSHERAWCEIDEIVVVAHGRRRGVARALITRAVQHSQSLGVDDVELTTWAFNAGAQAAFQRMGFRPTIGRYRRAPG